MRLFISINPGENTIEEILKVQEEFKKRISVLNEKFLNFIKWEQKEKFHLTLFFIGESGFDKSNEIDNALREVSRMHITDEFSFSFRKLNAFPKLKFPRVIFLELINEDNKVFELSKNINEAMLNIGFKSDKKFYPHITLGRVKRDYKINLSGIDENLNIEHGFSVNEFFLMESRLEIHGSEYTVLKKYPI